MNKDKIQDLIDFVEKSNSLLFIINTTGPVYGIQFRNVHNITFKEKNVEKLFKILKEIKDSIIVFEDITFWLDDDFKTIKEFISQLTIISKTNNLIINT